MNTSAEFIPPMINGVSASKVFLQPSTAVTVYDYLCTQFPHIQTSEWQSRFQEGLVYDAQGNSLNLNSPFRRIATVFIIAFWHTKCVSFRTPNLFENEHFLVIDKPHFLTMSPTGQYVQETLLVRLKKQTGIEHLTPIHRLDRETAGVVLISKNVASRGLYQQLFATRQVQKTYHAIAGYREELRFPQIVRLRMDKGQPFYTMQVLEGEPNSENRNHLIRTARSFSQIRTETAYWQAAPITCALKLFGYTDSE